MGVSKYARRPDSVPQIIGTLRKAGSLTSERVPMVTRVTSLEVRSLLNELSRSTRRAVKQALPRSGSSCRLQEELLKQGYYTQSAVHFPAESSHAENRAHQ